MSKAMSPNPIQSAITELMEDKALFRKFELNTQVLDKYSEIDGNTKVFDYWYRRFKAIESQVETVDSIVRSIKEEMQKEFNQCHLAATLLLASISPFTSFKVSQLRADVDFIGHKTSIVLIYDVVSAAMPETIAEYKPFLSAIHKAQEECKSRFSPQNFDFNYLYANDPLSIECIIQDYPHRISSTT
jgi:hypothetical protein